MSFDWLCQRNEANYRCFVVQYTSRKDRKGIFIKMSKAQSEIIIKKPMSVMDKLMEGAASFPGALKKGPKGGRCGLFDW